MFLGFARGKVGSVVFSRANGQQITRAKADVVRNPQTQAQTIQRIFLNTIAQAYSAMSAICDHSFEGLQKGQQSMSYFMKQNMNALRSRVAQERAAGANFDEIFEFSPLGTNYFAINDYVVAKGQLPQVAAIDDNADATMAFALDVNTYQGVLDKYGLQRGDQITFVGIAETSTGVKSFKFVRVILDPREANGDEAPLNTAFITDGAITKPSPKNEGSLSDLAFTTDHVSFGFGSDYLRGAAIIVSRKGDDGNWLRSNATLVANPSSSALVYDLQRCLDLFAEGGLDVTNPRFLNNSGVSNMQAPPVDASFESCIFAGSLKTPDSPPTSVESTESGRLTKVTIANRKEGKTYTAKRFRDNAQVGSTMTIASDGSLTPSDTAAFVNMKIDTYKWYEDGVDKGAFLEVECVDD